MCKGITIKVILLTVVCASASLFLFCVNDYNPFNDPANAKVYLSSETFSEKDSIALYETGTFEVLVAARQEVDSFTFQATNNRFQVDTTLRASSSNGLSKPGPYRFEVSFYDTGLQAVTITTYRSNGEVIPQDFTFKVYHPLRQEDKNGYFGESIVLETPPVPDEDLGVMYHWNFGGNLTISSVTSEDTVKLPLFSPRLGSGELWVSDLSGKNITPSVFFSYSFNDTSKPQIRCFNAGLNNDTIKSADTLFAFRAFVADAEGAVVESCSVNNEPFDFVNRSTSIHTKHFSNLPELTRNKPLALNVLAIDNRQFGNTSRDTFHVLFDPEGATSANVFVSFTLPLEEKVTTSQRIYRIFGNAENDRKDTMQLTCTVNGKTDPFTNTIYGNGEWNWKLSLDSSFTTVKVSAKSTGGVQLASAKRVIIFDSTATDTVPPMIWEVSAGGQFLGTQYYTPEKNLILKIVAFDDGSGLKHLSINDDTLTVDSTSYIWSWNTGNLEHKTSGNTIRIVAKDNRNNKRERSIIIYQNTKPSAITEWIVGIPEPCCMENTYVGELNQWDADGDNIHIVPINVPEGMTVTGEGVVEWKPVEFPTTYRDTLIVELSDAYQKNRIQRIFTRRYCTKAEKTISFVTDNHDIPAVLQAGSEQLKVQLVVNANDTSTTPGFNARFIDNSKTLDNNNNILLNNDTTGLLQWNPTVADTGYYKLMVTVGDRFIDYDTLIAAFHVVPKNMYACSLSVDFTGEKTLTGGCDLFSSAEPETLYFSIHDYDHPLTESYQITTTLGSLNSVEVIREKTFFVAIKPNTSKETDTLIVTVNDHTKSSDSLQFIILYEEPGENVPPQLAEAPPFPPYFCVDSTYTFTLKTTDFNDDEVTVITLDAPPGMTISNNGAIEWTPALDSTGEDPLIIQLTDQTDTTSLTPWYLYSVDCAHLPPEVRFKTVEDDFPVQLQAIVDSVSLILELESETGVPPFTFTAKLDNGNPVVNVDTAGQLSWIPRDEDTGERTLEIVVTDRFQTSDTIRPPITVLPQNRNRVTLSYTYSGMTLPSGELTLFSSEQPETTYFEINDDDDPQTEAYVVIISHLDAHPDIRPDTLYREGSERSFTLVISQDDYIYPYDNLSVDTFIVAVSDSTGTADTVRLAVRFPLEAADQIEDLAIDLNSTGVTTVGITKKVFRWSYISDNSITLVQERDNDRRPTLDESAVNGKAAVFFDHITDDGDDGLFDNTYTEWAKAPFAVFIVFSPRTIRFDARQTLISTNTPYGFGVGLTCDNTIGIFNDGPQFDCTPDQWAGTDLTVEEDEWYIVCFQSDLGITTDDIIEVDAWLNGQAASESMQLATQSDGGMSVGTGSNAAEHHYNGSFDGWIATIVMYDRVLSPSERILVERYLGTEYAIELTE